MASKNPPKQYKAGGSSTFHGHGLINSNIAGRTDKININVPENSFVVPADVVSSLGEGNTHAGARALDRSFPAPKSQAQGKSVPIVAAGGEYVIHPQAITKKYGNMDKGQNILRELVAHTRAHTVHTLSTLKPPKS